MRKLFKILGIFTISILVVLYCGFLFLLPKLVDLSPYKSQIQQLAKEQARLNVNFENFKLVTTPNLSAGISLDNLKVKLPDNSNLLGADSITIKLSVPSLLKLQVKTTKAQIDNLKINAEIKDDKQYKFMLIVQDIINEKKKQETSTVVEKQDIFEKLQEKYSWFNPEWITINIPDFVINNYDIKIDDTYNKHFLSLRGEKLNLGYKATVLGTKQSAKLKTFAELFSDENKNITANIDVKTFLPNISREKDTEDDPAEYIEFPFVNPVSTYRMYDFKTNISSRLRITNKDDSIFAKGYVNIENILFNVKGLSLPEGYIKINADGDRARINTDFYVAKDENIQMGADVNFGQKKSLYAKIETDRIFLNDIILLAKGILNTMQIRNNLDDFTGRGYLQANTNIFTDFNKLRSNGCIIARNGFLMNKKSGKLFDNGNLNFIFADNKFIVTKSHIFIGDSPIKFSGLIDDASNVDFSVKSEKLPLTLAFNTLAPKNLKNNYVLSSGNANIDFNLHGTLKNAAARLKLWVSDLNFRDKNNKFVILNKHLNIGGAYDFKNITAKITNKDFQFILPDTNSVILNPELVVNVNNSDIKIENSKFNINKFSQIILNTDIKNYSKKPEINVYAEGNLFSGDILHFVDKSLWSYFDAKGSIPIKFSYKGDLKRSEMLAQAFSTPGNYVTPLIIKNIENKPTILRAKVIFKKNRLNIKETGLFEDGILHRPVVSLGGTIVNLNTKEPFINIFRINIPQELRTSVYKLKNSNVNINGHLTAFGNCKIPFIRGNFNLNRINFPELPVTLDDLSFRIVNRDVNFDLNNLRLNKTSDINIHGLINLNRLPRIFINNVNINSKNIDLDKALVVSENIKKVFLDNTNTTQTNTQNQTNTESPIILRDGKLSLNKITTGNITLDNTTGTFDFIKNIFDLKRFSTDIFKGKAQGSAVADLNDMSVNTTVSGIDIDTNTALIQLANMKNTVSGKLTFNSDIKFKALDYEDMIRSLNGKVNFEIGKGQFGDFGKFENFLLAENIRESEFFKTTIGSMISSFATIDTTHFDKINGDIKIKDGIVKILPVKTIGNVMCLYVFGDYDILGSYTDLKVRGRLASMVSNVLGPLGQLNPINVVKATPGVNYLMLKAFSLFCESVTQEEMDAIPQFEKDYDNNAATKFQIVVKGKDIKITSMIKSFKWLAATEEIASAQEFMDSLPPPTIDENGNLVMSDPNAVVQEEKSSPFKKIRNIFKKGE